MHTVPIHAHKYTNTLTYTHTHAYKHTYTHTHPHKHTHTCTQIHTYIHTNMHTYACTYLYIHLFTYMQAQMFQMASQFSNNKHTLHVSNNTEGWLDFPCEENLQYLNFGQQFLGIYPLYTCSVDSTAWTHPQTHVVHTLPHTTHPSHGVDPIICHISQVWPQHCFNLNIMFHANKCCSTFVHEFSLTQ